MVDVEEWLLQEQSKGVYDMKNVPNLNKARWRNHDLQVFWNLETMKDLEKESLELIQEYVGHVSEKTLERYAELEDLGCYVQDILPTMEMVLQTYVTGWVEDTRRTY